MEQLYNVKASQHCQPETRDQANSYEMNVYSLIMERVRLMHPSFFFLAPRDKRFRSWSMIQNKRAVFLTVFKSKSDRQFDSFLRVAGRNKRLSSHASIQNWLFNDHLASYASYFLDELILNSASFERKVKSYFPSWIELLRYSEIIFEKMWKDVEGHWYMLGAREDVCPIFWEFLARIHV